MSRGHKSFKDQGVIINDNHHLLERNMAVGETHQMYTNWGLQQFVPALEPILPMDIPGRIKSNAIEERPMFDGMLRQVPVGEPSAVPPPIPPEARAPREPNADSDNE
ncbi:hypothetical protein PIB30_052601 [Stylosanthes scabra]|uniref:Uncharacterized protein n=1 Tax=Stylosanthes scabra TaxID=79078 RepID=A0ABU6RI90_9FABA|nr:hypothetical protein [Stylosanthes scabra]